MEETSHSIAHFMAVGAEKRLEDYHFLRNTYETITSQEIQLNRILRMLGEDEISLNWRVDLTSLGRAQSRSPYDFDRWANSMNLKGSIAYERLRESEQEPSKNAKPTGIPPTSRRLQEIRERRQRLSEQREFSSESIVAGRSTSSSSRLQALAEYETALAQSNVKRQQQSEQNQINNLRNDEQEISERKRERLSRTFTDDDRSYNRSKQYNDDETNNRSTRKISTDDNQSKRIERDRGNDSDKLQKSSLQSKPEKSGDIELIAFTVHYQIISSSNSEENEDNSTVRLLCRWASPSSSSAINYFTIEHQSGDNQWLPIGEQIDKLENQTKLDIILSNDNNDGRIQANIPSYFRLKAHLQNGQTFTSKPTDRILIDLLREKKIIKPNVEILSQNSVQLTWQDTTNEIDKNEDETNEDKSIELYDIEKKEEEQPEWEKVTEVPVSQQSARLDSITDAAQCQFRLIPTLPEPEEIVKSSAEHTDISLDNQVDSDELITTDTTESIAPIKKQIELDESETLNPTNFIMSSRKPTDSDESSTLNATNSLTALKEQVDSDELDTLNGKNSIVSSTKQVKSDEFDVHNATDLVSSQQEEIESDESITWNRKNSAASSKKQFESDESEIHDSTNLDISQKEQINSKDLTMSNRKDSAASSNEQIDADELETSNRKDSGTSSTEQINVDELESSNRKNSDASLKKQIDSDESTSRINAKHLSELSDNEVEAEEMAEETEGETEVVTVNNVNEWLNSLHVAPTSSNTVDVDISEEGFQQFDRYKIEYTTNDRPDQWKQASDITYDAPHLTIDKLKQGTDYKFRFTPISSDATTNTDRTNASQFSLVLDVRMPSARKGRFDDDVKQTPTTIPPQFSIQKIDPTTVLIEAIVPEDEPATFKEIYDVFSKKDVTEDDDWTKVGTIDKKHLSTTVENLEENTVYAFKIDNITSPLLNEENNTVQEFQINTTPMKKYDPSLFLEKIEQSLENVLNGVMQAAAGHQAIEEPVNKSLNEVIKEVFRDENLLPNEEYGFDTLALNNDLQVYRGPKQMMIKDLEIDETIDLSEHYGEIIIHNYRTSQQSVIVREENGNTRVNYIDGDVIIRNVISDVILKNEQTHHQLSMNIVGQAFLKGVQGSLIASKFKGIIVVKNVNKP